MRSKAVIPNVLYMMTRDSVAGELCRQNNFNLWSASHEVKAIIGNKVKVIEHYQKANIPYIPNICTKIQSYEHFQ